MPSSAREFLKLFQNNPNAYAEQQPSGNYKCIRRPVTDELLMDHFLGIQTLGMYAVNPADQTSRYLCWDCDSEADEQFTKLINWLAQYGIHGLREAARPGRWGHYWVLLKQPIPASDAYKILYHGKYIYQIPGEIYPHNAEPVKTGLQVRLPLGRHRKPSANGVWGLFEGCPDKAVDRQLMWLLEQPLNDISELLSTIPVTKPIKVRKNTTKHYKTPLLELFPANWGWRECGNNELNGRCPVCCLENHDFSQNNLFLNTEKNTMKCFFGNGIHKFTAILAAAKHFTKLNTSAVQ